VKFAGGSYIPKTDVGLQVEKIIRGELASADMMEEPVPESEEE
jgi:hypothetical protein